MKLKKAADSEPQAEMSPVSTSMGSAVIADRFRLDVDADAGKGPAGVGKVSAMIALVCSLVAIALLGLTAWLLFQNWDMLQNV